MSEKQRIRLKPKPIVIADDEGFENTDLFGLSEYGERLANLICNAADPLVTILDGPWGSGKTVFAKQWAGLMRNRGARVIYFDAFANDHYEDALTPLAAQILSALPNKKLKKRLKAATLEVGKHILPVAANLLIRAGTAGLLAYNDLHGVAKDAGEALGKDAGLVVEKTLEARLEAAGEEKAIFQNFRTALEEASKMPGQPDSAATLPLVFIIDELDRCRPTFAINLIERVKHLFSVPGVQFLLIAHLPQLEEAVRHCYGLGLGKRAKIYLEKFYDVKMTIPENPINLPVDKYVRYLWQELEIDSIRDSDMSDLRFVCFEHIRRINKFSLRTTEKILANIALAYSVVPRDPEMHDGFLIEGLCIIRYLNYELYRRICLDIEINLDVLENVVRNNLGDQNGAITFGTEANIMNWLSDIWKNIDNLFELEKLQWTNLFSNKSSNEFENEFRNVQSSVENRWTYLDANIKSRRYLSPQVIRVARIIDSMSPT